MESLLSGRNVRMRNISHTNLLARINDKKASKTHGIRNFPALSMFKMGEAIHYEGDLLDADAVLDFLSAADAHDVPGQIEDVTAAQLEVLVQQQSYLAVFFCKLSTAISPSCDNLLFINTSEYFMFDE